MMAKSKWKIRPRRISWFRLLVATACLAVIAALLFVPAFAPWLLRAEHWTADWRTAYLSDHATRPNPKIAIVIINDETLKDLPSSPIDRGLLARLVTAIKDAGATSMGLDILFLKKTEDAKDQALIETLKIAPVVLGALDERGNLEPFQRQHQTAFLAATGRPVGYLNLRIERDAVVRYAAGPFQGSAYPKSFARTLAETAGANAADNSDPIPWTTDPGDGQRAILTVTAQDILNDPAGAAVKLKDRIVLVGGDFQNRDRHRVPLSVRDGEEMTGVMIHAHILAGLLDPMTAVKELGPDGVRWFLAGVGVLGFLLGWLLWQSNTVGFIRWSLATSILLALDAVTFKSFHLLLPFTLALIVWFASVTAGRALHLFKTSLATAARVQVRL
jgi:CHASE2 domain-containing sensor protein